MSMTEMHFSDMSRRLPIVLVGVAAILVLVAGAAYIQSLRPRVSEGQATSAAMSALQQQVGDRKWTLVTARYDPAPDRIYDDSGNLIMSETRSVCRVLVVPAPNSFCHAKAAWILHLSAQGSPGSVRSDAYVVVNASTGEVKATSVVTE